MVPNLRFFYLYLFMYAISTDTFVYLVQYLLSVQKFGTSFFQHPVYSIHEIKDIYYKYFYKYHYINNID